MLEEQKDLSSSAPQDPENSGPFQQSTAPVVVADSSEEGGGDSDLLDCPVVGVGASAGGLEAYVELL